MSEIDSNFMKLYYILESLFKKKTFGEYSLSIYIKVRVYVMTREHEQGTRGTINVC